MAQIANDQLSTRYVNIPILKFKREIETRNKINLIFFLFTKASNLDELICLNEENESPPTIDKSMIECPQIEVLYSLLVYLRLHLPKCHPCKKGRKLRFKKDLYLIIMR